MSSTRGLTKGGQGKPKSSKSVSRSQKAGLQFPMGCITWFLKASKYAKRVSAGAPFTSPPCSNTLLLRLVFDFFFFFQVRFRGGVWMPRICGKLGVTDFVFCDCCSVSLWIWVLDLWIYAIRDFVQYLVLGFSNLFGC